MVGLENRRPECKAGSSITTDQEGFGGSLLDRSKHGDQDDGADRGRDQAPQQPAGRDAEQPEEKAPQQGADHTNDQVADEGDPRPS